MPVSLHQNGIIEVLNAYIDYHHFPIAYRLDTNGICSGLAMLYAKAVLENKADDFLKNLEFILEQKSIHQCDVVRENQINQWVIEILKFASPELFTNELGQATAYQSMLIDGETVKSVFSLGLVTTSENWVWIFKDINLQTDEAMVVGSVDHAITISRAENGSYVVYDPNYVRGIKYFKTEKELLLELRSSVFAYHGDFIGLSLRVLKHPCSKSERVYPDIHEIYDIYLPDDVSTVATANGRSRDSLHFATKLAHPSAINDLMARNGSYDYLMSARKSLVENQPEILNRLLPKLSLDHCRHLLFFSAYLGEISSFRCILSHIGISLNRMFNYSEGTKKFHNRLLNMVARGGNAVLLREIMDSMVVDSLPPIIKLDSAEWDESTPLTPIVSFNTIDMIKRASVPHGETYGDIFKQDAEGFDTIMQSMCARYADGLDLILNTLEENKKELTPDQKLDYLIFAIQQNNSAMVETLIGPNNERISQSLIQTLHVPFSVVRRTDLNLLKILQKNGVVFSKIAEAMIAQKEHHNIGMRLSCGVLLMDFVMWLKAFFVKSEITYQKHRHQFFRHEDAMQALGPIKGKGKPTPPH